MRPASSRVTCEYGRKGSSWSTGEHGGIDYGTPTGDPVYAMWGGTVTGQSWGSAYGKHVVIDHDRLPNGAPGLWAVYAHLSRIDVTRGDRVEAGQRIGLSGATGNVSGPHLHVEVQRDARWRRGNYTDPQPWIDATKEDAPVAWKQTYSGKPDGIFQVPAGDYKTLDVDVPDPGASGLENHMLYVNVTPVWRITDKSDPNYRHQQAQLRIRYKRESGDNTAYSDYLITPIFESWLITDADHWEKGEKGQGGRWQLRVEGDAVRVDVGTRYCKTAVIY